MEAGSLSEMGSVAVIGIYQHYEQLLISAAQNAFIRGLIDHLTSLNPGDAIFTGQKVNLHTYVQVDVVKERKIGGDQKAVEQWI